MSLDEQYIPSYSTESPYPGSAVPPEQLKPIPCSSKLHHACVVDGNPEYWPLIGGVVTRLTDFLGEITGMPIMNGYWGFVFLLAIIVSISLLVHKFAKSEVSSLFRQLKRLFR